MNAEELRALQAPFKQKYKDRPESAMVTLKANAQVGEGITCKIETGKILRDVATFAAYHDSSSCGQR